MASLKAITPATGEALEYAPFELNLYHGCTHGCTYCYVPGTKRTSREEFLENEAEIKKSTLENLEYDLANWQGERQIVHLCFLCDPYPKGKDTTKTRQCLELFRKYNHPFQVLTKNGTDAKRDFDLYGPNDRFGITLTCDNDADSLKWEPGAALWSERIEALKAAHDKGIQTWVSLEPVIDPAQSLHLIDLTLGFVDHYGVGKLNHNSEKEKGIDWLKYRSSAEVKLHKKSYKIKAALKEATPDFKEKTISVMPIVGSGVFELCIFGKNDKPEYVGYYDDVQAADKYIADHPKTDIYITPQRLNPSLIQRGHNKMERVDKRTQDTDVLGYRYLLVDLDTRQKLSDGTIVDRPSGVSATDEEHQAALDLGRVIVAGIGLKDENYISIDSGNGCHIYIPVEPGIQAPAIKAATEGLKVRYDTDLVKVDPKVSNPARLMRAPGSINCKGAIKRPCVYLHYPEHLIPVPYEFIAGLKVDVVVEPRRNDGRDLAEMAAEKLGYLEKKGNLYVLKECPFCHSTDKGAAVGRVGADGGYWFTCHHKRCNGKKWADLKEKVGLAAGRLDNARKVLREMGAAALEMPEFQDEISKLKATGELPKLEATCQEVGIGYKALKAAARKPLAIAQDLADGWIREYHIKTDRVTRDVFYYQDGVYIDAEDFIASLIDDKFRGLNTDDFIKNVTNYIKRHSLYDFTDEWLGLKNGLINPTTLEIADNSPDLVTRIRLNVEYDPDAQCPRWLKFLDECKSDVVVLQETAGYSLLPRYPYEKAIMLLGSGGQGKSVFLRVLGEILGTDNVSAASLQALIDNRFATSDLYGRLANIAGDIPDMALSNSSTFKTLTGDDRTRAERKGKQAFEFWNRAKLIFSANALPPTKDKSTGYMRRWILIDFRREMVQHPNIHLAAELLEERSGILNWMLEGARRVNTNGFTYTTNQDEMARRYIERSEPVVQFLEANCIEDFDGFVPSSVLFAEYNNWAQINKKKRMGSREFTNAMKNQSIFSTEPYKQVMDRYKDESRVERSQVWGFNGIKMRETTPRRG